MVANQMQRQKVTVYGIKNCNTMKKVLDKLTAIGVVYEFFDYKKQPISSQKIQTWIDHLGIDKVLNKQGMTWKNLNDEQKQTANESQNAAINLMIEKPSMIKRPIIEYFVDGKLQYMAGYSNERYEEILG